MPQRPRLHTLPRSVRAELHQRLAASDFGDLVGIARWLNEQGHPIGKSAVGLYAKRHRAAIEVEVEVWGRGSGAGLEGSQLAAIRLGCLQAAAAAGARGALERADRYFGWVTAQPPAQPAQLEPRTKRAGRHPNAVTSRTR